MDILIHDEYRLTYDGMGYDLLTLTPKETKAGAVELYWKHEGYYGDVEQAIAGAYKHRIHESAITAIEQIKTMQDAFAREMRETCQGLLSVKTQDFASGSSECTGLRKPQTAQSGAVCAGLDTARRKPA